MSSEDLIEVLKSEIAELRRWRHDLEGMGIMRVIADVELLKDKNHKNNIYDIQEKALMDNLTKAVSSVENSVQEIRRDFQAVKKGAILTVIGLISVQVLPPNVISVIFQFVKHLLYP